MANLYVKVDTADLEELALVKELRYTLKALEFELFKAYETIEFMNQDIKELDKEILSLQDQVLHLEQPKEHGNAKLTRDEVSMIKYCLANGRSTTSVAEMFNVAPRTIRHIKNGTTWGNV